MNLVFIQWRKRHTYKQRIHHSCPPRTNHSDRQLSAVSPQRCCLSSSTGRQNALRCLQTIITSTFLDSLHCPQTNSFQDEWCSRLYLGPSGRAEQFSLLCAIEKLFLPSNLVLKEFVKIMYLYTVCSNNCTCHFC